MSKAKKNALRPVKTQNTALMNPRTSQRGFEAGVDQGDLIIPRAKLIQALSPE